jgi:preprotein translocase subunit SecG
MPIHDILRIAQIAIAAILIGLILLGHRGGVSAVFGGMGGEFYGTRRGLERIVFILTIVFAALFVLSALVGLVIQ